MDFAITTRWNAGRHDRGEDMIEEILNLGVDRVELGYDLRLDLVPGVQHMVEQGAVKVGSVHNFCPVPVGAPQGHPELFTMGSLDRKTREGAVHHTTKTIRFAAEIGASVVVTHAGNVDMKRITPQLIDMHRSGDEYSTRYEKLKMKMQVTREKKGKKQIAYLYEGLEQLLPVLEETNMKLGIENLPTWEALPTEMESEALFKHFGSDHIGHWHDIGHGRIRHNLGLINQVRWLEKLESHLVGMHIHDVAPPAMDHLMPSQGTIDFHTFKRFATLDVPRVIEPTPRTSAEDIVMGLRVLREAWDDTEA